MKHEYLKEKVSEIISTIKDKYKIKKYILYSTYDKGFLEVYVDLSVRNRKEELNKELHNYFKEIIDEGCIVVNKYNSSFILRHIKNIKDECTFLDAV